MQEFSSVTASSYDAESLAPLLSEKSADGWDVISIVSAGTNIVAYLSREASDSGADTGEIDASASGADDSAASEAVLAEAGIATDQNRDTDTSAQIDVVEDVIVVPSDPTPFAESAVSSEPSAVEEPAGWAAAPEETAATEQASVETLAAQVAEPTPAPAAVAAPAVAEPAVAEPAVAEPAVAEPAVAAAAAATTESTVPAGWYADPSGRYELRYWDGSAWTEHVSRAGQQFTDPPVA